LIIDKPHRNCEAFLAAISIGIEQNMFPQSSQKTGTYEMNDILFLVIYFMDKTRMRPPEADKLAGYPHWVQSMEYPNCPVCSGFMNQLIFQLASEDNIPYMWCDGGIGYLVQCPEHQNQVTFFFQSG